MAEYINAQTLTNISSYPNTFQRGSAFPLDQSTLFSSLADAQAYASTDGKAYVGQPLVVSFPGSEWTFSDNNSHTLEYSQGFECWTLDNEYSVDGDIYDTTVEFTSLSITATRTLAPSVKSYIIGADGTLIEMGTKAEIDEASGDASAAVAALDLASTAIATIGTGDHANEVTINAVKQVDGQLSVDTTTTATKVTLAKVAKTGAAANVSIADSGNKITATDVEGALAEIATEIDNMDVASTPLASVSNNVVTIKAITETDGVIATDTSANTITLEEVAYTGNASDVAIADAGDKITATTVEDALQELAGNISSNAVTMTTNSSPSDTTLLKTYTLWAGGSNTGTEIGTINIPKDYLVKSGELKTVTEAGVPYTGAVVGDKYLDFVLNTKSDDPSVVTDSHIYVPVNDLFDSYTSGSAAGDEITITVNNSTNKISATINKVAGSKVNLTKIDGSTSITAQAAYAAMNATTTASTASEDTSAIAGISVVTGVTQVDGVVSMTTAKADKYGSASKAKADVIGADTDAASANTVYGAKAYTDAAIADLDTESNVGIASVSDNVVTLTKAISETDGIVGAVTGTGSTISLEEVAMTGAAADVSVADADSVITATTVEGALTEIAKEIDGMNLSSTAVATVSSDVVTINAIKEVEGKVSVDTTANTVTLSKIAKTGAAADVSIADAGDKITATTVEGALQELAGNISDNSIDIQTGSTDGTIKWKKSSDNSYTEVTPKNLKTVATTGAAADVSIADADSVITATTVEGALQEIAKEIDGMDATLDASATGLSAGTTVDTVAVMSGVNQDDGKLTSVDSVLVDKAGSAAAVLGSSSTDTKSSTTVHGAIKLAKTKAEYLGTATALTVDSAAITVGGSSITASTGDYCTYSGVEYFWNGSAWTKLSGVKSVSFAGTALTVGSNGALSISKSDALSALNVADGAQVNVIETIKVGGTALTVTDKAVDINNLIIDGGSASITIS